MSKSAKSTSKILSTWTPLNNEEANRKVFEERRELFCKWFEKWSDNQRKKIINDVLKLSKQLQLQYIENVASKKVPVHHMDFTRVLPRVITLYIFQFLDPRTLCRCAQVCWYWRYLSELDQMWMLKCMKLGWELSFTPGPYEKGLWKRNYVENFKNLQYLKSQIDIRNLEKRQQEMEEQQRLRIELSDELMASTPKATARSQLDLLLSKKPPAKPAWRGSDPTPKDTLRYNYLNNDDDVEIIKALRTHGLSGPKSAVMASKAKSKVKSGKHALNTRSKSLHQSVTFSPRDLISRQSDNNQRISDIQQPSIEETLYSNRPSWAKPATMTDTASHLEPKNRKEITQPSQASHPLLKTPSRSERDLPASGAFEVFVQKPWKIPEYVDSD